MDAREIAALWELAPHPEGGFYRETYRSGESVWPPDGRGQRSLATSILFLLGAGERSRWHRVAADELWLWQDGAPMTLEIGEEVRIVGPDRPSGQELQVLVPAGAWQRATPLIGPAGAGWSLVACLVTPGFAFEDFEVRGD